jgi:hypothetical protein
MLPGSVLHPRSQSRVNAKRFRLEQNYARIKMKAATLYFHVSRGYEPKTAADLCNNALLAKRDIVERTVAAPAPSETAIP